MGGHQKGKGHEGDREQPGEEQQKTGVLDGEAGKVKMTARDRRGLEGEYRGLMYHLARRGTSTK